MGSGLLKKANLLNQEKGLAFSSFIQKYSKKTFALFTKTNNFYFIKTSLRFDGLSILSSYSTSDFWNGLIPGKNKVYNFIQNDNSLNKMLQFFSFNMKEKISMVSIYAMNDMIILLCNEEITDDFIHDISLLNADNKEFDLSRINQDYVSKYSVLKYKLNYLEAVESYVELKTKKQREISEIFKNALLSEISNRLNNYFYAPNLTITTKVFNNNIIIFSEEKVNAELLLNHLILNLRDVIENCAELIEVEYIGKAETYNEIKDFLKVE